MAAPFLLSSAAAASAQGDPAITSSDLRRHIEILASDDFQGRAPGTEGETRTINYIAEQFRARGLEPAGAGGSWFQPVGLVERTTRSHRIDWSADARRLPFDSAQIALQGRDPDLRFADAPVVFAGHGARMPDRGIDQLAGADLRGAVVLLLFDAPGVPGFPSFSQRVRTVTEAGAAAVIAVTDDLEWRFIARNYQRPTTKLAVQVIAPVLGAMPIEAAQRLIAAAGGNFERLLNDQPGSSFRAVPLPLRADIHVLTSVRPYATHNVIGRLRGSGSNGESLLYLGHWDHFGLCRPEGEADRICNGAVDNASGIATIIEVAGRLARAPRPARDVLFLATTAEEMGLLGVEYFATHPVAPLASIAAAINVDTVAIAEAGLPVDYAGRGSPTLDAAIEAVARARGRTLVSGPGEHYAQRNDAWVLASAGVPAVGLIGGSFADPQRLNAFLSSRYHGPDDEAETIVLDGAAEDADLLVALGRRLADPAQYQRSGD